MKPNLLLFAFLTIILSSCGNMKKLNTFNDDVYLDPSNDREAFYPKPVEKSEPVTAVAKQGTTKDDSLNPYYKDKDFNYDDYYDNEYAARLKRFHDPMYGVGYYDSYYTNSYFYNHNPYQYNVSIYNGYNFWPTYSNYSYVPTYNWGMNFGYGTNFGYNPYNYNSFYSPSYYSGFNNWCGGWNNPYYPYGYGMSPLGSGFYNGYNNGYYNGFNNGYYYGYNNSLDYNSGVYYGPRASHSGYTSSHDPVNATGAKFTVNKPIAVENSAASPASVERFTQIKVPEAVRNQAAVKGGIPVSTGRPNMSNGNSNPTNNSTATPVIQHKPRVFNDNESGNSNPNNPAKTVTEPKKNNWGIFNDGSNPKGNDNEGKPVKQNFPNSGVQNPTRGGFDNEPKHSSPPSNNGTPRSTSGGIHPR